METYEKKLANNELLKNLRTEDIQLLLDPESCIIGSYKKNTIITQVGDPCNAIGFILDGEVAIQQLSPSGGLINLQIIHSPDTIGAVQLFSNEPIYPYSFVTLTNTNIVYVPASSIDDLLSKNITFARNYISMLSNRFRVFNEKILLLSQKDVRSRLIYYFSTEFLYQNQTTFLLRNSKTEIADLIGVARPSVSRELKNMQNDGLIVLEGNKITLLKPDIFRTQS